MQRDQCGHERFVLPFVLARWRPAEETAGAFDEEAREAAGLEAEVADAGRLRVLHVVVRVRIDDALRLRSTTS